MADEKDVEFKDKIKVSYFVKPITEEKLMKVYINRLKKRERPSKSQLIDEAVNLLYEHELKGKE